MVTDAPRRTLSARARIIGAMVILTAVAFAASIMLSAQILSARSDALVDGQLSHSAASFRNYAESSTGRSHFTADALLTGYLQYTVANDAGTAFSLIDGLPARRMAGDPPLRLDRDPNFMALVAGHDEPTHGRYTTSEGEVAYAVIPVSVVGDPATGALVSVQFRRAVAAPLFASLGIFAIAGIVAVIGAGIASWLIAGRRVFAYSSAYFDTPGLDQFRAHRQGRRRRFKVRTRTYLDSGLCMFEAKLKGVRGETDKHRIEYPLADKDAMNRDARTFLTELLHTEYGLPMPQLGPVMAIEYRRGTLVNPLSRERLTLDVELLCRDGSKQVAGPDLVVVETKSADGRGVADRVLAEMGIRELSMSKYCIGIALLHPQLPANRWNRVLRNRFDWDRAAAA